MTTVGKILEKASDSLKYSKDLRAKHYNSARKAVEHMRDEGYSNITKNTDIPDDLYQAIFSKIARKSMNLPNEHVDINISDEPYKHLEDYYFGNNEDFSNNLYKKEHYLDKQSDKFLEENDPDFYNELQESDRQFNSNNLQADAENIEKFLEDNGPNKVNLSEDFDEDIKDNALYNMLIRREAERNSLADPVEEFPVDTNFDVDKINYYRKKVIDLLHKDNPNRPELYKELVNVLNEREYPVGSRRYKQIGNWLDRSENAMYKLAGIRRKPEGYHGSLQDMNRMNAYDQGYDADIDVLTGQIEPRVPIEKYQKHIDPELKKDFMDIFQDKFRGKKIYDKLYNSKRSETDIEKELIRMLEFID